MDRHPGIVVGIDGHRLQIRLLQTSGCSACGSKDTCPSGGRRGRLLEVSVDDAGAYRPGSAVWVSCRRSLLPRAVGWAFGLPFLVVAGSLALLLALGLGEAAAGLLSLALLAPYYTGLWLCRKRMSRRFPLFVTPA